MAAESPAMPLPTTSTSTSDENATAGPPATLGAAPSSPASVRNGFTGIWPAPHAASAPPAAREAAVKPASLKNPRRFMAQDLFSGWFVRYPPQYRNKPQADANASTICHAIYAKPFPSAPARPCALWRAPAPLSASRASARLLRASRASARPLDHSASQASACLPCVPRHLSSVGPSSPRPPAPAHLLQGPRRFPDVAPPSRPHRFLNVTPSFLRSSALPERRPRLPKPDASQR